MTGVSRLEAVYRDLEKENRRLMQLSDRLRAYDSMDGLLPQLDKLRTLLIVHFAREQLPDGFYEALGKHAQINYSEIQRLINDHKAILAAVNALLADAKTSDPDVQVNVLTRLAELLDQLQDHEKREHRFATEALKGS